MGTQRTIINNKSTAEKIRLAYSGQDDRIPTLRVRAEDSIVVRDFRRIQRRDKARIDSDESILMTDFVAGPVRAQAPSFPTLVAQSTHTVADTNPYKEVTSTLVYYTLTGGSTLAAGSNVSVAADAGSFIIPTPSLPVVAANEGVYTLDAFVTISSIDVYLLEDVTVNVSFEQDSVAAFSVTNNDSAMIAVLNAESNVEHVVTIQPAATGGPGSPTSVVDSVVAAASVDDGSVLIAIPSMAAEALGNYTVTIARSHATDPVTLLSEQPVQAI